LIFKSKEILEKLKGIEIEIAILLDHTILVDQKLNKLIKKKSKAGWPKGKKRGAQTKDEAPTLKDLEDAVKSLTLD